MTKTITTTLLILSFLSSFAQTTLSDSISLEAGYTNDVYYSMKNRQVSSVNASNWHIAFSVRKVNVAAYDFLTATSIWVNEGHGVSVYESSQTTANWNSFDTTGYQSWNNPHNNDSSWNIGAFNGGYNISQFNFGWGNYDQTTNDIDGNKMYCVVIKTTSNTIFKKLTITKLDYDSTWIFSFANLDGSDSTTATINKSTYSGKLFAYYDLVNKVTLDREPSTSWDLLFTRYGASFGPGVFLTTTGVLLNSSAMASKITGVDVHTVMPSAGVYQSNLTTIGTDWKINPGASNPGFTMVDSLAYFVKPSNGAEYRMVFTGFDGSSTGKIFFNTTEVTPPVGVAQLVNQLGELSVYPNPAKDFVNVHIANSDAKEVHISVLDLTGRVRMHYTMNKTGNTFDQLISTGSLAKGIYFISLETNGSRSTQKLIVE